MPLAVHEWVIAPLAFALALRHAARALGPGRAVFELQFSEDTEITGSAALHIWMSADEHTEMDVFVGLRKIDTAGREVGFRFFSTFSDGPVALGWLRASHRALSPASTPLQPIKIGRKSSDVLKLNGNPPPITTSRSAYRPAGGHWVPFMH